MEKMELFHVLGLVLSANVILIHLVGVGFPRG